MKLVNGIAEVTFVQKNFVTLFVVIAMSESRDQCGAEAAKNPVGEHNLTRTLLTTEGAMRAAGITGQGKRDGKRDVKNENPSVRYSPAFGFGYSLTVSFGANIKIRQQKTVFCCLILQFENLVKMYDNLEQKNTKN